MMVQCFSDQTNDHGIMSNIRNAFHLFQMDGILPGSYLYFSTLYKCFQVAMNAKLFISAYVKRYHAVLEIQVPLCLLVYVCSQVSKLDILIKNTAEVLADYC